jgi:hypothetical protein
MTQTFSQDDSIWSRNRNIDYLSGADIAYLQGRVQVFHGVVHEGALLPTLLSPPNFTIIWDGRICMFAVLLRFTLSFVYKVYIGFLSCMRDWTVAVAQYSKFAC